MREKEDILVCTEFHLENLGSETVLNITMLKYKFDCREMNCRITLNTKLYLKKKPTTKKNNGITISMYWSIISPNTQEELEPRNRE